MTAKTHRKRAKKPVRSPRQPRSRATVDAIVEAAARILATAGWAGFNTNAIAERAGVSIGTLYEYFKNKHALLDAVVNRHLDAGERALSAAAPVAAAPLSPDHVIEALVDGYIAVHREDPALHRALSSEAPVSEAVRARVAALDAQIVRLIETGLQDSCVDPKLSAALMVAAADALAHRWIVEEDGAPLPAERLSAELKKMFSAYLRSVAA